MGSITANPSQTQDSSKASRIQVSLNVNGTLQKIQIDPRTTLLDALREYMQLTGSKKGCDQGQCGACTVHINGRRVLSCLSLAVAHQSEPITTIEGLASGDTLHPMQSAFLECDALQCGYCTPGQIMSATAMLEEAAQRVPSHATEDVTNPPGLAELTSEEIRERMSGNICRCGAYPNIVEAIEQVKQSTRRAR